MAAGDYLYAIAQKRSTTVEAIQAANNMGTSTTIYPGQLLRIPPCQCYVRGARAMRMSTGLGCANAVLTLIGAVASLASPGFSGVLGATTGAIGFAGAIQDNACSMQDGLDDEVAARISGLEQKLRSTQINNVMSIVESVKTSLGSREDPTSYRYALADKSGAGKQSAIDILKRHHAQLDPLMNQLYGGLNWDEFAAAAPQYLYLAATHSAVWQELINLQQCEDGWRYYQETLALGKYMGRDVAIAKCEAANPTWTKASPDYPGSCFQMVRLKGFDDNTANAFNAFHQWVPGPDPGWHQVCS